MNPYVTVSTVIVLLLAWAVVSFAFAWLFGAVIKRRDAQRPRYRRSAR